MSGEAADASDEDEIDADDSAQPGSVLSSYIFQDTLTTTVVTPLNEPEEPPASVPKQSDSRTAPKQSDSRASGPNARRKFDLNLPLQNAIPGYKAPKGLKKKRKTSGKKKILSKKEKAKNRGDARRRE